MIRSMTAFGRARGAVNGKDITVELKSVNNRYFDCSVKVSRMYGFLEEKIKAYIAERGISRGKIDVMVNIDVVESVGVSIRLDEEYAKSYVAAQRTLRDLCGLKDDISVSTVSANRDLFLIEKPDEDTEQDWEDVLQVLTAAVDAFIAAREREGKNLAADISAKKERLATWLPQVEALSEQSKKAYYGKLEAKLRQVLEDHRVIADEGRIVTECAIYADKVAVDEETVRLHSHFEAFDEMLTSDEPVGRKLDFLLQEMNRETNTIGSKCCEMEISKIVIDMKAELEKIREQIQNIE